MGLEKVKNLGNFLFSTIKGAGQKIKETVSYGFNLLINYVFKLCNEACVDDV